MLVVVTNEISALIFRVYSVQMDEEAWRPMPVYLAGRFIDISDQDDLNAVTHSRP